MIPYVIRLVGVLGLGFRGSGSGIRVSTLAGLLEDHVERTGNGD